MGENVELRVNLSKEVADKLELMLKEEGITLEEAITKVVNE